MEKKGEGNKKYSRFPLIFALQAKGRRRQKRRLLVISCWREKLFFSIECRRKKRKRTSWSGGWDEDERPKSSLGQHEGKTTKQSSENGKRILLNPMCFFSTNFSASLVLCVSSRTTGIIHSFFLSLFLIFLLLSLIKGKLYSQVFFLFFYSSPCL